MSSVLTAILSYLLIYKYVALFAIMISAAIAVPLPTDAMLVAIGAFSFQGYFSFWLSLAITVSAEVIGDFIDYSLAKRYGHKIIRQRYAKKYSFFLKLEGFFHKYTGLTIFFTRFVGILSPLTNFLSGFEKIEARTFLLYDFLGNTTDSVLLLTLGYLIGDNWEAVIGKLSWIGIIGGSLLAALLVLYLIKERKSPHDTFFIDLS